MSSYQVLMKMPLSGCKMKLSEMLSIMIVRLISRPSRDKSFTRKGPFCDVCWRYSRYLMLFPTSIWSMTWSAYSYKAAVKMTIS